MKEILLQQWQLKVRRVCSKNLCKKTHIVSECLLSLLDLKGCGYKPHKGEKSTHMNNYNSTEGT